MLQWLCFLLETQIPPNRPIWSLILIQSDRSNCLGHTVTYPESWSITVTFGKRSLGNSFLTSEHANFASFLSGVMFSNFIFSHSFLRLNYLSQLSTAGVSVKQALVYAVTSRYFHPEVISPFRFMVFLTLLGSSLMASPWFSDLSIFQSSGL